MIEELSLEAHPEGGWFRRTWTHPDTDAAGRPRASAILYLLRAGERSHWHRVDAVELWQFVDGDPLVLSVVGDDGVVADHVVGAPRHAGARVQVAVPAHAWQSAVTTGDHTLVTCTVVPAFVETGFELAPAGWSP